MKEKIIEILDRELQLDMPYAEEAKMKVAEQIDTLYKGEIDKLKERLSDELIKY